MNQPMTRITIGAGLIAASVALLLTDVAVPLLAETNLAPCFWLLLAAALAQGCREFTRMLAARGQPVRPTIALVFVLIFQGCAWLETYHHEVIHSVLHVRGLELYLLLIIGLIYITFLVEFWSVERSGADMARALASVGWTVLVVLTVGLLGVFLAKVRFLEPRDSMRGLMYLALTLGVVKAADIGAYAIGSAVGRHRLVPKISPKKTVEGLLGGLAAGIGMAMAIGIGWGHFTWPEMLVFGAAVSISGVLGDLAESLIKRACGVKDSGPIPGFGGALDILDSMLAAGPVAYLVLVVLTGPVPVG
jgi:phosphatidate cytidylyltransferase